MVKPFFTRKNLIFIALTFFYSLIIAFTGICIDGAHLIISKKNLINLIAQAIGFQVIEAGIPGLVTLILISIYVVLYVAAVAYIRRYAMINNKKAHSPKYIAIYVGLFLICCLLSIGVGCLMQANLSLDKIGLLLRFVFQSILLGTVIFAVIFGLIAFGAMLIINFLKVDKPFTFWGKHEEVQLGEEIHADASIDISSSFDINPSMNPVSIPATTSPVASPLNGEGFSQIKKVEELDDREKVFPALNKMDIEYGGYSVDTMKSDDLSLLELAERFRNYLAKEEKLYFDINTIRIFVSAFAASHFMILEGLSGTGKSSLPRYFAKFINANLLFVPVQTTWRDKSSIFGYFNDFSKTYVETDFLLNLYHANYNPDQIHIFVLDEMNISRVEYYFADLLSLLEYPKDEWKLKLMQLPYNFVPPAKLDDGVIQILDNSYFVGTANKDDSTFSITDKVYDRAITIDFDYRNEAFEVNGEYSSINLSKSKLHELYEKAMNNKNNYMTKEDYDKLKTITDFIYEQFDVTFGNRILNQIEILVPVFIACGGKKEDILDFLLTRKILVKIEGRFEEYVKNALKQLLILLSKVYGKGVFKRSEKVINNMIRRL